MLKAGNFEHGVVASRPDQMYGWPGITRVEGDHILVSASERKYHIDPVGREVVIHSYDGGKTWDLPQEVFDSELDDRDANLLTMADGTLVLTWFTSTAYLRSLESGSFPEPWQSQWLARAERQCIAEDTPVRGWLMRSNDGGYTWEDAHEIPVGHHAGPTVLSDNRIIYINTARPDGSAGVWASSDKGDTWTEISKLRGPVRTDGEERGHFNENHVLEISPGRLLVMVRTAFSDSDQMYLYQATSDDGGYTWTELEQTSIWGYPAHLTRLSSGALLCVYGHRRDPFSIRAVLSYDEGRTWDTDNIITLYDFEYPCDMGYPVSLEVTPGQILTVFYSNLKQPHAPAEMLAYAQDPGGILSTRWTLQ
jgi:sialidase-1